MRTIAHGQSGRKVKRMRYEAEVYGDYAGRNYDYQQIKNMFTNVSSFNSSELADWTTCDFRLIWEADDLRDLQKMFWKYFHGTARNASGMWSFNRGKIKDAKTGNVWNVNSWGRHEKQIQ